MLSTGTQITRRFTHTCIIHCKALLEQLPHDHRAQPRYNLHRGVRWGSKPAGAQPSAAQLGRCLTVPSGRSGHVSFGWGMTIDALGPEPSPTHKVVVGTISTRILSMVHGGGQVRRHVSAWQVEIGTGCQIRCFPCGHDIVAHAGVFDQRVDCGNGGERRSWGEHMLLLRG